MLKKLKRSQGVDRYRIFPNERTLNLCKKPKPTPMANGHPKLTSMSNLNSRLEGKIWESHSMMTIMRMTFRFLHIESNVISIQTLPRVTQIIHTHRATGVKSWEAVMTLLRDSSPTKAHQWGKATSILVQEHQITKTKTVEAREEAQVRYKTWVISMV